MRRPKVTLALASQAPIPAEWDCLTSAEFAVCKSVRDRLGAEAFEAVPLDTLVCFVRALQLASRELHVHDMAAAERVLHGRSVAGCVVEIV